MLTTFIQSLFMICVALFFYYWFALSCLSQTHMSWSPVGSFHCENVTDYSLFFYLRSPQVVQMAWWEETLHRGWWDCRQTVHSGQAVAMASTLHMAKTLWWMVSKLSLYCSQLPVSKVAQRSPWGLVVPDWWCWQWKGCCWWVKMHVSVFVMVSFCNSTDRWSRFDLKVVLISPSLSGEMGQSGRDNLHSLAGKQLERKGSENNVCRLWFMFALCGQIDCMREFKWSRHRRTSSPVKDRWIFTGSQMELDIALSLHFVILLCFNIAKSFFSSKTFESMFSS